jgi:ATP-dependent Zn protease
MRYIVAFLILLLLKKRLYDKTIPISQMI